MPGKHRQCNPAVRSTRPHCDSREDPASPDIPQFFRLNIEVSGLDAVVAFLYQVAWPSKGAGSQGVAVISIAALSPCRSWMSRPITSPTLRPKRCTSR
jgi:hypothetical protein